MGDATKISGDGHLFLFDSADVAAHFGLKLIAYWKQRRRSLLAMHKAPDLPIRVGCHFGECSQLAGADHWIGQAINIAKRVEAVAEPDTLFITQTILELVDLPFYEFREAGFHDLKGDFLPRRQIYRLLSVDHAAMAERRPEEMSAEDWFLKGVGMADRACESPEEEMHCYQNAIRLRPNYPEAHNNLAILLKKGGQREAAHEHYREALRIMARRDSAGVRLITRNGNDFTARFPLAAAAIAALPGRSFLIDGEAIVTDDSPECCTSTCRSRTRFQRLSHRSIAAPQEGRKNKRLDLRTFSIGES